VADYLLLYQMHANAFQLWLSSIHNMVYRMLEPLFQALRLQQTVVDLYRQSNPYQSFPSSADCVDVFESGVVVFVLGFSGKYKARF
jgi:hypothetical protein